MKALFQIAAAIAASLALAAPISADPSPAVGPPPAALHLDPFYAKYADAGGIPVIASRRVPDAAVRAARAIVTDMLDLRPDIRAELIREGVRVGVMAIDEATTDLPEQSGWKKPARDDPRLTLCEKKHLDAIERVSDRDYWNARARGTGGLFTTVGAENLLAVPGTRYFGENILVHEFSHIILTAVQRADPALYGEVERAYAQAMAAGRFKGDYASVNLQEYWAEGTQFWFNSNMLARLKERTLLSDADLRRYDPALSALLKRVYGSRHRLAGDPFYNHPASRNVPVGYQSSDC
jgi:hypothetical protein